MSQIVEYVNYTEKRGEHIERVEEVYEDMDAVKGQNPKTEMKDTNIKTQHTGRPTEGDKRYRLAVACVLLLCFLLLTATTVLWIKFNILSTDNGQLQTTYDTLRIKNNQLQTSNIQTTLERDHLQERNYNLTKERDQQQATIENQEDEIHKLLKINDTLNIILNNLGKCTIFSDNSSIYFISNANKKWEESRKICTDNGADLVIINSTEKQDFISKTLSGRRAWIGLSDRDREGEWKWVDDTLLTTGFWAQGEPNNNAGDVDCVITQDTSDPVQNWADYPCNYEFIWICEKTIFN